MDALGSIYPYIGWPAAAIAALQLLALSLRRRGWLLDLLAQFAVFGVVASAINAALALASLDFILAAVAAVLGAGIAWHLRAYFRRAPRCAPDGAAAVKLMSHNVLYSNRRKQDTADAVLAEDPDLVLLMEVDQEWLERMDTALGGTHPHAAFHLRQIEDDSYGIAFYSRRPFTGGVRHAAGVPHIDARLEPQGARAAFRFIGLHLSNPIFPAQRRMAAEQVRTVLDALEGEEMPVVVAGDFNSTPTGSAYRELARGGGLRAAGHGRPLAVTWHLESRVPALTLDHVLVSPDVAVVSGRRGPRCGSDHNSVVTEFIAGRRPSG